MQSNPIQPCSTLSMGSGCKQKYMILVDTYLIAAIILSLDILEQPPEQGALPQVFFLYCFFFFFNDAPIV